MSTLARSTAEEPASPDRGRGGAEQGTHRRSRQRVPIPRLSTVDLSNLRFETRAAPMHVGALLIVEGAPLLDVDGRLRLDHIRSRLDVRLVRVPALRQRLLRPGLFHGRPLWIDDETFDIRRHVCEVALSGSAEDDELFETVERLMSAPLVRSRPLWEMWLITGLSTHRLGILFKLHHALADGLAAVSILSGLFDFDPNTPDPARHVWCPQPAPKSRMLFADNVSRKLATLEQARGVIAHPLSATASVGAIYQEALRILRTPKAPRTSLTRRVGPGRRVRYARFDLSEVRGRGHEAGGKVNDVVLDLTAGALRELLLGRGERVDGLKLIAAVPVALRATAQAGGLGNAVGVMTVPLDIGEGDANRRLESIVAATLRAKQEQHPAQAETLMAWLAATPIAQRFITRQHLINVFITNVTGPPVPMYVLGARILDIMPIVFPSGNVAMSFCAFSYAGGLILVISADLASCPDIDRTIAGARRTWLDLRQGSSRTAASETPLPLSEVDVDAESRCVARATWPNHAEPLRATSSAQ
jgi:diacylglycerol O-acyltransferase / wax synthase